MKRTTILVCGPHRDAASGVSTHVNLLMGSTLAQDFELVHFQVGSEGRTEGRLSRWLRLLASPFALFAAIVMRRVQVLHLNTSLNPRAYWRDVGYLLVAKLLGTRVLYQVHGGDLPAEFFANRRLLTALLRFTLHLPDLVVVLANRELAAYREFVPGQHVVLLPNGIDCRPFARVPTVRSRADHPLRVIYIGRLAAAKGLYEAIDGLRVAVLNGVDARLVIGGDGPEAPGLRMHALSLGLGARVAFAGPVFGDAKVRLMQGADVAILPSYAEGLPYSLLEAMAAGIPVLATPVGAIPDVVSHGVHGFLVPPRDAGAIGEALIQLASDRERLSWMSRACRKRVLAAYSIERLARELAQHYRALSGDPDYASPPPVAPRVERRTLRGAVRPHLDLSRGD